MKRAIICENRPKIASFVKQTLLLAGYNDIEVITEITAFSMEQNPYVFFIDMEFAYSTKQILNNVYKKEKNLPTISFYQVENNQVTGFWNEGTLANQTDDISNNIFIRSRGRLEKVHKQDILYIESDKKYCTISTLSKKYVLRTALKHLYEQLNHSDFVRVHRSYLVNKNHIRAIDTQNQNVTIENKEIPIGRYYQNNLFQQIKILQ